MTKISKFISVATCSLLVMTAAVCGTNALKVDAASAVTTVDRTTSYNNSETMRAIKVENDSFTIRFTIGEGSGNWGFAQFSAFADTAYSIGNGNATVDALDLMVSDKNINVNQNNGWSECNAVLVSGQGAGWITDAYTAGVSDFITVSKANSEGDIKIACNAYPDGVVIGSTAYKNGKTLTFDQLVDDNGYTYFRTAATTKYSLTLTDTWKVVDGIQFKNVLDTSKLKLTKAYDEKDKELIVADYKITSTGYELICDGVATLEFTDGENTVKARLGENVVFPVTSYSINTAYKLAEITASSSSNRFSIGDMQYGMVEVKEDSVKFNFGIYYDATPASHKTFNICIGPNTYVQSAGENISNANYKTGVFSLFTYVTNGGKLACEFYDSSWKQHTNTVEYMNLNAGELNVASVEIKKETGVWNLYVCGTKVESVRNNVAFDFNALIGDTFMNALGKVNFAVVGHSASGIKVSLLGTKVDVLADLSIAYDADFYGEVVGAYDADGKVVEVYDGEVSETGYSFVALDASAIKKVELATIGGVTTKVDADVANKTFVDTAIIGAAGYDRNVTVSASDATLRVMDGETDVSAYYEIVNNNGAYTIKGVNKPITVIVDSASAKSEAGCAFIGWAKNNTFVAANTAVMVTEDCTMGVVSVAFTVKGASIKTAGIQGLRFKYQVNAESVALLESLNLTVAYGTRLTHETLGKLYIPTENWLDKDNNLYAAVLTFDGVENVENYYDDVFTATAYVEIDGVKYYANATPSASIAEVAHWVLNNSTTNYSETERNYLENIAAYYQA